jgi:hypothetical protein
MTMLAHPTRTPKEKHLGGFLASFESPRRLWATLFLLILVWGLMIAIVNPVGEFQVNDDWSFQKALENLVSEGKIESTGWGPSSAPGGPSLIFHLLWGWLFTLFGGWSVTTLRISVLAMGILGSIAMLILLCRCTGSDRLALWGTLTFILNPLVLAECFTYMSDVTFVSVAVFSLLFIYLGVQRDSILLLIIGLVFALCSILTRQTGIVIPMAFLAAWYLRPEGTRPGMRLALLLVVLIVLIPWLMYEYFLSWSGGTPLTQHQVVHNILHHPRTENLGSYLRFLAVNFGVAMVYVGFLVSPILAFRFRSYLRLKSFLYFALTLTAAFFIFECALLTGLVDPPVGFWPNMIFNFGIGPILLKDTYIMEIQRTVGLPKALFYLLAYWAVLSAGALMRSILRSLRSLFQAEERQERGPTGFLSTFCLLMILIYLGLIILSGFHVRYLIPVFMWAIVWLMADNVPHSARTFPAFDWICGLVPLVFMGLFAVTGTHDFMAMKRTLLQAQNYLVSDLGMNPCNVDGGLEFNGYHCYRSDFVPKPGLSWWWVEREDYLLALGPLDGYNVVRIFPFQRIVGGQAAIYVLRPAQPAAGGRH